MAKSKTIKKPEVEKSDKKTEKKEKVEEKKSEETQEPKKIIEIEQTSGWERLIDNETSSTLDRRVIQRNQEIIPVKEKLEDSLKNVEVKEGGEKKENYASETKTYNSEQKNYLDGTGVLGRGAEMKREDEISNFNQIRTFTPWRNESENPSQTNAYEMKRNAEETLNKNWGVEGLKKYTPMR